MMNSRRDETAVGIVAFTNTCPGFTAILKQRYSDFIVREIDLNHEIASLSSLDGKGYEETIFPSTNGTELDVDSSITNFTTSLKELVEMNDSRETEISVFLQGACDRSDECPSQFLLAAGPSKELRTKMHQLIKKYFQPYLDSDTMTVDGVQWIRLLAKHKPLKGAKKWRAQWPSTLPNYLKFKILKENIDTMSAVNFISKHLRIKQDTIKFAGTKDKRAVTVQWATAYRMKPSALCRLNHMKFPFIRIGDFSYVANPITLGQLSGNRFEIVLREVQSDPTTVQAACEGLKATGYVNYFGLQRFGRGGSESGSHLIGLQIFQSNWKGALDLMFKPLPADRQDVLQAKTAYQRGDYAVAKDLLPSSMYSEIQVLERLISDPRDHHGAFHSIPRSTQLICVHALQSFIFNLASTHRIEQYGREVVVGDLVSLSSNLVDQLSTEDVETEGEVDSTRESNNDTPADNPDPEEIAVHVVTEEDIVANRYTIRDVILPLIGKNVTLPSHQTGEFIKSLLLERGLSLETINRVEKSGVKSRVRGHYRRVIEFPAEFSYRLVNYSDPNETIQLTEINTLNLQQQPEESHGAKNSNPSEATRLGLVIEFNLSAGSYATMLLRELMKEATDSSYHAELTAASAAVTAAASSASSTRGEKRKESEIEESVTVGSGAEPEGVASKRVKESGGNGAVTGEEAS